MKYVAVGNYKLPAVAVGCMGLAGAEEKQQREFVSRAKSSFCSPNAASCPAKCTIFPRNTSSRL